MCQGKSYELTTDHFWMQLQAHNGISVIVPLLNFSKETH